MIARATPDAIAAAATLIRRGEVVAFPTETVYGLGADATNAEAVARVFAIKQRPSFDPIIIHIDGIDMGASVVAAMPPAALALAERFWPGPLTLVLPKTARIPDIATAGLPSVGIRVPDHSVALALITATRTPIAAPSANPFGYVSPTTAAHVEAQIRDLPMILDDGPCRIGIESTIVSFVADRPTLLRPGGIPLEDIERTIGPLQIGTDSAQPLAPGQLPRHYAPRLPLAVVTAVRDIPPADRSDAALLLPQPEPEAAGFAHVELLSPDGAPTTIAANLFAALRRLESGGYRHLYAVAVPEVGLGRAIMDRLRRASAGAPGTASGPPAGTMLAR
jgi:L-threonylcarbamoyladenylate synthase